MRSSFEANREAVPDRSDEERRRMHGGKATGTPKGNKNAWKHGNYSSRGKARRVLMRLLLRGQDL
jgi:hypothetical protein